MCFGPGADTTRGFPDWTKVGLVMSWKMGAWFPNSIWSVYLKFLCCLTLSPPPGKTFPMYFIWSLLPAFIYTLQLCIHIYFYLLYSSGHCLVSLDIDHFISDHTNICAGSCCFSVYCVCITISLIICTAQHSSTAVVT